MYANLLKYFFKELINWKQKCNFKKAINFVSCDLKSQGTVLLKHQSQKKWSYAHLNNS